MESTSRRRWSVLVPGQVYLVVGIGEAVTDDALREMELFDQECLSLLNTSQASLVHFINDLRQIKGLPPVTNIRKMQYLRHPRLGYYITMGALPNSLLRFIGNMVSSMIRLRYNDASSLDEACALLAAKDPTLPPRETWTVPVDLPPTLSDRLVG